MTKTGHDFYNEAITLRNRIVAGQSNERPVQAWAAVCRACANASNAYHREFDGRIHGRLENNAFNNLDRVWWHAKAQVETLGRVA